jgi:predicted SAM-dependent methyltransferase
MQDTGGSELKPIRPYPYLPDLETDGMVDYLDALGSQATRGLERGPLVRLARRFTSRGLRERVKLGGTIALEPFERRRASRALHGKTVRLNLGSGPVRIPGWLSVDIVGMNADVTWDIRRGLPFPDCSVEAIFMEHVVEHFTYEDTLRLLAECRRALEPGGVIRLGVPDFGRYMQSYAGDGEYIESLRPRRPTRLLAVAEVALRHGHRSVWDAETLEQALTDAGFVEVKRRRFGESDLEPAPDTSYREPETVYAEGRRPPD